jgi:hypothetical protein
MFSELSEESLLNELRCSSLARRISIGQRSGDTPSLKDAYNGTFLIGTALDFRSANEFTATELAFIKSQFNAITPENSMKPGRSIPRRTRGTGRNLMRWWTSARRTRSRLSATASCGTPRRIRGSFRMQTAIARFRGFEITSTRWSDDSRGRSRDGTS